MDEEDQNNSGKDEVDESEAPSENENRETVNNKGKGSLETNQATKKRKKKN